MVLLLPSHQTWSIAHYSTQPIVRPSTHAMIFSAKNPNFILHQVFSYILLAIKCKEETRCKVVLPMHIKHTILKRDQLLK